MSIWQLTAWKKNINLVEITQTIFITNYNRIYLQAKPFMNPPRSCPIDIFCRFHWIPVSGSESDYKEIGLEDINIHRYTAASAAGAGVDFQQTVEWKLDAGYGVWRWPARVEEKESWNRN